MRDSNVRFKAFLCTILGLWHSGACAHAATTCVPDVGDRWAGAESNASCSRCCTEIANVRQQMADKHGELPLSEQGYDHHHMAVSTRVRKWGQVA